MGNSLISIGFSGLSAAQAGLTTSGHNIANASTPGFHRQSVVQNNAVAQPTGGGFLGRGTQVDTVRRMYSDFLDSQVTQTQTRASYLDTYHDQVSQIDSMFGDASSGVAPALQDLFSGVQALATDPASLPSRQALLSSGASLVARFHAIDQQLTSLQTGVNTQIEASVSSVNSYADRIASINEKIVLAKGYANGQPPNDLLDQRYQLIEELNKLADVTVINQSDGSLNIMIGSGQSLVMGPQAMHLKTLASPDNPERTEVGYTQGSATGMISSSLTGGSLGALLAYRNEMLDPTQNALGRVALVLGQNFNDQHKLGQDLNGAMGGNFFSVSSPAVLARTTNTGSAVIGAAITSVGSLTTSDYRVAYSGGNYVITRLSDNTSSTYATLPRTVDGVAISLASGAPANGDTFLIQPTRTGARNIDIAISDPASVAAAAPIRTGAGLSNTGSATVSAGTVNSPPPVNANLQQPVTITFTGANTFSVTGTGTGDPAGVAYSSAGNITYNGWTIQISGAPAAGDTFTVSNNASGVSDSRNALALGALQTAKTTANGSATYQSAYGLAVSLVGNKTREMQVNAGAQSALLQQAQQAQQSVAGVNLDEEAANLIRYQQAYQASGKVIQVASDMFDTLLSMLR
jgi:flagellar hook-associated protein 1 FlgK